MNYYDVFGLSPTASPEDISAKHKALAKMYHPDISSSKDAHEKMAKLNEANEVLSDSKKRRAYDKELRQKQHPKQNREFTSAQAVKTEKSRGTGNAETRAGKAELLRQKAEARLRTDDAARAQRKEQAQKKAEETAKKKKQTKVELDKQHVINVLSALVMGDNAQRRSKKEIDEERHYATKVLLSLVRKDDAHLRRRAEEAEHKQRIEEILSLVKEYNNETK